jgi:hypothetical protein
LCHIATSLLELAILLMSVYFSLIVFSSVVDIPFAWTHISTIYNQTFSQLSVRLPNGTVLEGQLVFFSAHYGLALLDIMVGLRTGVSFFWP